MNLHYFTWNAESFAAMKLMWIEGKSASEIGRQIGCSRAAVLGKIHRHRLHKTLTRMSFPKSTVPPENRVPPHLRKRHVKISLLPSGLFGKAFRPLIAPPPTEPPDVTRVSIVHITGCRWPMTALPPHFFCNGEQTQGSSYCAHHRSRSVTTFPKKLLGVE